MSSTSSHTKLAESRFPQFSVREQDGKQEEIFPNWLFTKDLTIPFEAVNFLDSVGCCWAGGDGEKIKREKSVILELGPVQSS